MIVKDELYMEEEAHRYWEIASGLRVISVTELLRHMGYSSEYFGLAAQEAMRRGKNVHLALHYHHRGVLDANSLSPRIKPYVDCALEFHRMIGGVCKLTEAMVFDPLVRLAATLDCLYEIDGIPTIIDYKTGAVTEGTKYQLAGQANGLPAGPYRRWALEIRDDGKPAILHKFEDDRDLGVVRMMASLFYTRVNDGVLKWPQTKRALEGAERRHANDDRNEADLFTAIGI